MDPWPEYSALLLGVAFGLISSYSTRMVARSEDANSIVAAQSLAVLVLGVLMLPAIAALLIWGFLVLPWYWVVATFLVCALVVVPLVFGGRGAPAFLFWWRAKPFLDLCVIAMAALAWSDYVGVIKVL